MTYDVFLDDLYFYGVTDFSFSGDREVIVYNGIGTGYFPKLDDPNLQKWSWTCELQEKPEHYHGSDFLPATQIFERLNEMKASLEPVRLVVKGENKSLSELVGLEGYTYKELYNGVYQVAVNVTEYKEAAVRTTTIPEIPRPGKIPVEQPFTIASDETAYDKLPEAESSFVQPSGQNGSAGGSEFWDPIAGTVIDLETGQETTIPISPDEDNQYRLNWKEQNKVGSESLGSGVSDFVSDTKDYFNDLPYQAPGNDMSFSEAAQKISDKVSSVFDSIGNAYNDFAESMGWRDGWDKPGQK